MQDRDTRVAELLSAKTFRMKARDVRSEKRPVEVAGHLRQIPFAAANAELVNHQ